MTAPFEPITVCEQFVYEVLTGVPAIVAQFPGGIHPAFSPPDVQTRHVTHDFAGPDEGQPAVPFGGGIALLGLLWDVTGWEPSADRQLLRPGMKLIQGELSGPELRGKGFAFDSDDGSGWSVNVTYRGPIFVPADVGPPLWQRVSGRFLLHLRQTA